MQLYGRKPNEIPFFFHREALRSVRLIQRCMKHAEAAECVAFHYHDALDLIKGMYSVFLPSWLDAWPRNQLLIWRFEDYKKQPYEHLQQLAQFLKLDANAWPALHEMNFSKPRNAAGSRADGCGAKRPPMFTKTRQLLDRFYESFNTELAHVLNWTATMWSMASE